MGRCRDAADWAGTGDWCPGINWSGTGCSCRGRGEAACRRQERGCIKSRPRHRHHRPSRDQREAGDGVTTATAAAATAQHQQVSSGPGSRGRGATVCVGPAPPRPAPSPLTVPTLSIFSLHQTVPCKTPSIIKYKSPSPQCTLRSGPAFTTLILDINPIQEI